MADIPEHLLQRSKERRRALGLPVPGEEGGEAPEAEAAADAPAASDAPAAEAAEAPAAADAPAAEDVTTESGTKIPAHLLERAKRRRAAAGGGGGDVAAGGGTGAAAAATATLPAPTTTGPGGHTQRLLTVVKSGSIQQTRAEAQDKVHTWPHLLVIEFAALLITTAGVTIFSALVRAPLLGLADFNKTPNPSKAPWYFLGLQELLTMFNPQIAGVLIPGVALIVIMLAPFIDKNPSSKPADRKFAIALFTIFLLMWAVLVILGSFFRGPGFNFILPWKDGIFFEL
ncbi:MAG TPA: menaquinol-cytochrome c reductase cytochrome b subunit [Acidimicrobiia bacterium]|nr:menaquinol-cytochrome c reductase cytochrome b subunit [Acidimicrobiia bacterium]